MSHSKTIIHLYSMYFHHYRFFNVWNKLLKCTSVHLCLFHSKRIHIKQGGWDNATSSVHSVMCDLKQLSKNPGGVVAWVIDPFTQGSGLGSQWQFLCFLLGHLQFSIFIETLRSKSLQWRIQDFPQEGAPTLKEAIIWPFFPKNCMKFKEFGPGGGRASLAPPLRSANEDGQICPSFLFKSKVPQVFQSPAVYTP